MANRKVHPEVQEMFETYVTNGVRVRRLEQDDAIRMLQKEFQLNPKSAAAVFDYFDVNKNGAFSLWEFQHFYNLAGPRAATLAKEFDMLDGNRVGFLTRDQMISVVSSMRPADGRELDEKDIDVIMRTAKDDNRMLLGDYMAIVYRVGCYTKPR